jgi:hypothetical protein
MDCDTEWFSIPKQGLACRTGKIDLAADPHRLAVSAGADDLRLRAVFRIEADESLLQLESRLADEGFVVLRDAFGIERLQLTEAIPSLSIRLGAGRYSVDANLTKRSTLNLELKPLVGAAAVHAG